MKAIALPIDAEYSLKRILQNVGVAIGKESQEIEDRCRDSFEHSVIPISLANEIPEVKFFSLKSKWEEDTCMLSFIAQIAMHHAYQEIIGMGKEAIPLILNEMKIKRGHWFWALKAITGEDPVRPEHRGNISKMTEDWLEWGMKNKKI